MSRSRRHLRRGATLIATLLILLVVLLLGAAAAQIALQGQRTTRNERDRQIALQAAEAALLDAEIDIEGSPDPVRSRSDLFSRHNAPAFPVVAGSCVSGAHNRNMGLCLPSAAGRPAVWRTLDFIDARPATATAVTYGQFTGRSFPFGAGFLPVAAPRYVIELLPDNRQGQRADQPAYLYRVTAVGFAASMQTQVALQAIYRKTR